MWRALDETLARDVAAKVLHDHLAVDAAVRRRFRRGAVAAAKLSHPNVVGLYDTSRSHDEAWLVMELVDGPALTHVLAQQGALAVPRAVSIAEQAARGLDHAHRRGIIHGDVKPANLLLASHNVVKLVDFALADVDVAPSGSRIGAADTDGQAGGSGDRAGAAVYVAPEQWQGQPADEASDQYSLACVLVEALTGRSPHAHAAAEPGHQPRDAAADEPAEMVAPTLPDDLPPGLADVVRRGLARDPAARYETAAAFADALAPYTLGGAGPPRRGTGPAAPATAAAAPQRQHRQATRSGEHPGAGDRRAAADNDAGSSVAAEITPGDWDLSDESSARRDVPWLLLSVGVILAVVALVGVVTASMMDVADLVPSTLRPEPSGEKPAPAQAGVIAPVDIGLFDPQGGTSESPEGLRNLLDGDPTTGWQTVGYNTPAFGNLKSGVGFWVDLGQLHELDRVAVRTTTTDIVVEVRVADRRADTPGGWRRVGRARADEALTQFPLDDRRARYVLVWVTGGLQPDGSGWYRAGFSELAVIGTPT